MPTIEEKKRLVEFTGKIVYQRECSKSYVFKRGNVLQLLCNWTPELGDDDLTELLSKLDIVLFEKFYWLICHNIPHSGYTSRQVRSVEFGIYLQNNKNAPTIVKAILEVIP